MPAFITAGLPVCLAACVAVWHVHCPAAAASAHAGSVARRTPLPSCLLSPHILPSSAQTTSAAPVSPCWMSRLETTQVRPPSQSAPATSLPTDARADGGCLGGSGLGATSQPADSPASRQPPVGHVPPNRLKLTAASAAPLLAGLMRVIAWTLNGLDVVAQNAVVRTEEGQAHNTFWLTNRAGAATVCGCGSSMV